MLIKWNDRLYLLLMRASMVEWECVRVWLDVNWLAWLITAYVINFKHTHTHAHVGIQKCQSLSLFPALAGSESTEADEMMDYTVTLCWCSVLKVKKTSVSKSSWFYILYPQRDKSRDDHWSWTGEAHSVANEDILFMSLSWPFKVPVKQCDTRVRQNISVVHSYKNTYIWI